MMKTIITGKLENLEECCDMLLNSQLGKVYFLT